MSDPRILVFRNGQIGNTLVAVPLLRALRSHWPESTIEVVVDALSREVLRDCPYVNALLPYDRRARDPREHFRLLRRLRKGRYDVALLPKRFARNEILSFLSGARTRVGFHTGKPTSLWLTHTVPYQEGVPIVSLLLDLLEPLGVPRRGEDLEFWWRPEHEVRFLRLAAETDVSPESRVAVHHTEGKTQSARLAAKEVLVEVADRLSEEGGLPAVFVFGPAESAAAQEVRRRSRCRPLCLVGEPLGVVAVAMSRGSVFIGHDSGPAHLARAVGLARVVIYEDGPLWESHLRKWGSVGARPIPRSQATVLVLLSAAKSALEDGVASGVRGRGPR